MTDQQRADSLGCYGSEFARTPHIDRLAEQGVRYDRAYVASPMCMPNRASFFTGRMPSAHGSRTNGVSLDLSTVTIADLLRGSGYTTAAVGKMHLQNMTGTAPIQSRPLPSERLPPPPPALREAQRSRDDGRYDQELRQRWTEDPSHELDLPYYGFESVDLCNGHGDTCFGDYGRWLDGLYSGQPPVGPGAALKSDIAPFNGWRTAIPEEHYPTSWVISTALERLAGFASADSPFFLFVSIPDPHHPFTPPGRYWDMFTPDDMTLPKSFYDLEDPRSPFLEKVRSELAKGDRWEEGAFCMGATEAEALAATALTNGMVSMVDDAVGDLLDGLGRLGLEDDTIVIFTSDHGEYLGDHGMLLKGPLHYQGLIKTPLIWLDPTSPSPGVTDSRLVSTVDVPAAILERAAVAPFHGFQGQSMVGRGRRDCVYIEDENQHRLFGLDAHHLRARTIVTEGWRLTIYDEITEGELFNLSTDPHEMHNVWSGPAAANIRSDMLELLAREQMLSSDRSPYPTHRS